MTTIVPVDGMALETGTPAIPVIIENPTMPSSAATGSTTDAAASSTVAEDATARSGISLWKGIKNILILINAKLAALGQAAMAASMPVVIASDQSPVSVKIDQTTAGTTNRVDVGGTALPISTPTLSVAGAYATGDYIGPTTTPASFANAVRAAASSGLLTNIGITDKTTTAAVALELWFFSATFVAPTDNAAWAITDAENLLCLGVVPIPAANWYASSNNKQCTVPVGNLGIKCAATSLFYALVARGATPTWADGDLQITPTIVQQ